MISTERMLRSLGMVGWDKSGKNKHRNELNLISCLIKVWNRFQTPSLGNNPEASHRAEIAPHAKLQMVKPVNTKLNYPLR